MRLANVGKVGDQAARNEVVLLGSVLLNDRVFPQTLSLRPVDFTLGAHGIIFRRMRDLYDSGKPIDMVTLTEVLFRHNELEKVGGVAYVSELPDGVPERSNIAIYVDLVRTYAGRKRIALVSNSISNEAETNPATSIARLRLRLGSLDNEAALYETGAAEEAAGEFSDDALALKFTAQHGEDWRLTAAWGRWSYWNGSRWIQDATRMVFDLVRKACRTAAAAAEQPRIVARVSSAFAVYAVERLASADRRHAATVEQWDADPWVLNTLGGIVDLRTGALSPNKREDYATKITAAAPSLSGRPLWIRFLEQVTAGDVALLRFLQRMCGYILTGVTSEHALFFLYGTGANGKSVFLNTISGVLGDDARCAPIETFVTSTTERHPTDLAGLRGARLVTSVETEDGRRWAESRLKALTGGDRIAARFMRQDFFEFTPQFKLLIAGNHKPGLRTVDEAMQRRFNLVPFTVTIPPSERDAQLGEKLRSEWSGILQWAIEGCLAWQREGLNPPAPVRDATTAYFSAEDTLGRWLDECCEINQNCRTATSVLFESWRTWAELNQEYIGSQRRFSEILESRGFKQKRTKKARGFAGIGLVTQVTD